jgi:hypothetical protein
MPFRCLATSSNKLLSDIGHQSERRADEIRPRVQRNVSLSKMRIPHLADQKRDPASSALPVHPWSKLHLYLYDRLDGLQILSRSLAGTAVGDDLEGDLLTFVQTAQASAFNRADVNENVLVAVFRLNESKTLLGVEPLYSSNAHKSSFAKCSKTK